MWVNERFEKRMQKSTIRQGAERRTSYSSLCFLAYFLLSAPQNPVRFVRNMSVQIERPPFSFNGFSKITIQCLQGLEGAKFTF